MHQVGASHQRVLANGLGQCIGKHPVTSVRVVGTSGKCAETESAAIKSVSVKGAQSRNVTLAGRIIDRNVLRKTNRIAARVVLNGSGLEIVFLP